MDVSSLETHHHDLYIKYVQLLVCQSYPNKVVKRGKVKIAHIEWVEKGERISDFYYL